MRQFETKLHQNVFGHGKEREGEREKEKRKYRGLPPPTEEITTPMYSLLNVVFRIMLCQYNTCLTLQPRGYSRWLWCQRKFAKQSTSCGLPASRTRRKLCWVESRRWSAQWVLPDSVTTGVTTSTKTPNIAASTNINRCSTRQSPTAKDTRQDDVFWKYL